ncbi:hypothetical protein RIF29_33155 [Crotalaria pallida]|uniref:B-like cyclin n=1 Tax=Crotalaria pallida TaxID=3830 RepID=A0AAN9HTW7_CROPI
MEEGSAATLSLLFFEHKKTFFGDFESNASAADCDKILSDETVGLMVHREREHLPKHGYLKRLRSGDFNMSFREEAYDWIKKGGKIWVVQLLALACLSIAAKMRETKVPKSVGFLVGDPKFVFDAKTIERMELLVLSTLGWKMQALTPSIDFLEFKPSEIAAAVAISVTSKLQVEEIHKALSCLAALVKEERVLKCLEVMRDLSLVKVSANLVLLDGACASSKSDEFPVSSSANSSIDNPNTQVQSNGPSVETCKP